MARVPDLRQITKEDFEKNDQKLIDKLAFPINNFMSQVINVLKNGIDFNNLNEFTVTFTVTVDINGKPTTSVQFKNTLNSKVIGIQCINALNQSSFIRYPQATPFISYTENAKLITVNNIAGLGIPSNQTNSDSYTLTVRVTGDNLQTG